MALLEVTALTKMFGQLRALDGVDLTVRAGTFHGLIGPNGSGKSTLLKAIAGAHAPTSGTIRFDDMDITAAPPFERARAGLSLKFQITSVLPELSVYDNVLLALQSREGLPSLLSSRTRRILDGDVMTALDRFRLAGRANDLAGELSHGQQQWLGYPPRAGLPAEAAPAR
jgi:ABC-type branched-subunit amino acid transport system ATPase component